MLTIEQYMSYIFELVRIDAQLEELIRITPMVPRNALLQRRVEQLHATQDRIIQLLDKSAKPVEIAPFEQYIEVEYKFPIQ